jgi:hypothetical protein
MATASLTKMTVPVALASDDSNPTQGLLMPKLKYRFRVTFENLGVAGSPVTELTKQVMNFSRPNVTFANIDLPIYNSTIRLAGKHEWSDITCELRDDAGGNVSRLVGQQLQKQLDFLEQSSAASGLDYKFVTKFEVLDGGNGKNEPFPLETWIIVGCYLQGVNYNSADYGDNSPMTVAMTIRYDNATQIVGVGTPIGTRTRNDVATGTGAVSAG